MRSGSGAKGYEGGSPPRMYGPDRAGGQTLGCGSEEEVNSELLTALRLSHRYHRSAPTAEMFFN